MDETPLWMDMPSDATIAIGVKLVPLLKSGHIHCMFGSNG